MEFPSSRLVRLANCSRRPRTCLYLPHQRFALVKPITVQRRVKKNNALSRIRQKPDMYARVCRFIAKFSYPSSTMSFIRRLLQIIRRPVRSSLVYFKVFDDLIRAVMLAGILKVLRLSIRNSYPFRRVNLNRQLGNSFYERFNPLPGILCTNLPWLLSRLRPCLQIQDRNALWNTEILTICGTILEVERGFLVCDIRLKVSIALISAPVQWSAWLSYTRADPPTVAVQLLS